MKKKTLSLVLAMPLLFSCSTKSMNLMHNPIQSKELQKLAPDFVTATAYKAMKDLSPYFMETDKENYVLSPASYLLAAAGLISVSDGFDSASFGLSESANDDLETMLEAWNFEYDQKKNARYCSIKSGVLHQQVGPVYAFDDAKREEANSKHVSTMVSKPEKYDADAERFFKDKIGLTLKVPNEILSGVVTYGALTMKDYVGLSLRKGTGDFTTDSGTEIKASSYYFGSENEGISVRYHKGENYQAFGLSISYTSFMVVLPDEGVDVHQIDIGEAYKDFMEQGDYRYVYGYLPFFHTKTERENLLKAVNNKLTGKEVYFSKLLKDDVDNDLSLLKVIQSSDFEFTQYGVKGESITIMPTVGKAAPDFESSHPIQLYVDRPFLAVSLKDNFPLFVSLVNDPSMK